MSMTVHMAAQRRFAKLCLKNPQESWNNDFWPDKIRLEMLGHDSQFVQQKPSGGYGLFCSNRTWHHAVIEVQMGLVPDVRD